VVEIDEGVGWPESAAQFFSRNYLAGMLDQHVQDLERLFLELQLDSILAQLARRNVYLEGSETQNTRKLGLWEHPVFCVEEVYTSEEFSSLSIVSDRCEAP
jgi:hypothetical protein